VNRSSEILPWRSLAVAAAALAVAALPDLWPALCVARAAVLSGELWRLWTAHLVHGSGGHLVWNVAALVGLGLLFERTLGNRLWGVLLVCAPLVGLGALTLQPGLVSYCGLSGVLNGVWVVGALLSAREETRSGNRLLAWLFRACVLADLCKIAWEASSGAPIFTDAALGDGVAVPIAHALGALGGMIWLAGSSTFSLAPDSGCAVR
jgi:rhomboid family GlyGly-CTERM serine protease